MRLLELFAVLASLALLVIVVETIRRNRLNIRYALLWLTASVVLLALSLHRPFLDWISLRVGISYPPSFLFLVAFLFLLGIVLHYSLVISSHRDSIRRLAQSVAMLERAIEEQREGAPRLDDAGREMRSTTE